MEIGEGCAVYLFLNGLAADGMNKVGRAYGGGEFRKQRDKATADFAHIFVAHVSSLRRGSRGCSLSNPDRPGDRSRKDARGG
jgi:hypothetical protein